MRECRHPAVRSYLPKNPSYIIGSQLFHAQPVFAVCAANPLCAFHIDTHGTQRFLECAGYLFNIFRSGTYGTYMYVGGDGHVFVTTAQVCLHIHNGRCCVFCCLTHETTPRSQHRKKRFLSTFRTVKLRKRILPRHSHTGGNHVKEFD